MNQRVTRRELLKTLGTTGAALGLGMMAGSVPAQSNDGDPESGFAKNIKIITPTTQAHAPAAIQNGKIIQPAREIAVVHQTDVLVVGGGSAGFAAAVAASRTGAKVALMERYGCLGGLWTGGLVLVLPGMAARENGRLKLVTKGIGDEYLKRLEKMDHAIIDYDAQHYRPTVDPEAAKVLMDEMVQEAGVEVFLHCWGADAIMDGAAIKGAIFESKAGRQAILAKIVIDASGDGDIFAAAGADFQQISHAIGLVHRLGNTDRIDAEKARQAKATGLGLDEPLESVHWVNVMGPKGNAIDVRDLTKIEMMHRKSIWNHVQKLRKTPGYEQVFLLQTAPQLGVRASRLLDGKHQLTLADFKARKQFGDVIAVAGDDTLRYHEWAIPYGALVPKKIDNLLTAGRCISCEPAMIDKVRLIPTCLVTGHAAGVAAALAIKEGIKPGEVEAAKIQKMLREQGAYLG